MQVSYGVRSTQVAWELLNSKLLRTRGQGAVWYIRKEGKMQDKGKNKSPARTHVLSSPVGVRHPLCVGSVPGTMFWIPPGPANIPIGSQPTSPRRRLRGQTGVVAQ